MQVQVLPLSSTSFCSVALVHVHGCVGHSPSTIGRRRGASNWMSAQAVT